MMNLAPKSPQKSPSHTNPKQEFSKFKISKYSWNRMFVILIMLLALGLEKAKGQAGQDSLGLLYEGKQLEVATVIRSERISIEYVLNATETEMREAFIKIKNAGEGWYRLTFLQGGTLKSELLHGIDSGVADGRLALSHAGHLYSFLNPDREVNPESKCVFSAPVLTRQTLLQGTALIVSQYAKIKTDWTEEQILSDLGKLSILYNFVSTFNAQMSAWKESLSKSVTEYDTLRGGNFPPSLLGNIELAPCLATARNEIIRVQGCKAGKDKLICEVEFNFATATSNYTELIPINYEGVELEGPEKGWLYAKDEQTQNIVLLNCSNSGFNNPEVPLCQKVEGEEKCLKGLLLHDMDFVVNNCKFRLNDQIIAKRLADNGILVIRSDAKVSDNGKMVFKQAPFVLYSNNEVSVSVGEDEIIFPNHVQFPTPKIVTSKIAKGLIDSLKSKAGWDDFWARFAPEDYLIYIVIGAQLIVFFPLSICGIVCRTKNTGKKGMQCQKDDKAQKKRNFNENRALLAGPVTMPIIVQTPRDRALTPCRRSMQ
jgi:hypothetical protein